VIGVGGAGQLQSSTAGIILIPGKPLTESGKINQNRKNENRFNGGYSGGGGGGGGGTSSSHENWRRTEVERWHGAHRGRIVRWRARARMHTRTHTSAAREPPTAHAYRTRRASATATQTVAHTHTHTRTRGYTNTRARRAPVKRLRFTRKLFDKINVKYKITSRTALN